MEHTIFKLQKSYIDDIGISEIKAKRKNCLLGQYNEVEDHYDIFSFDGDHGFVTVKVQVTGNDEEDEKLINKMVAMNRDMNSHAELVSFETSSEDEDLYFHQVTLKMNYQFDCDIAEAY
ncbi:MAG: hypothetical protein LUG96_02350 [Tannerellaceae bacterium]|nr:hypothetical protein [Tannerellaceae bacterium]